MRVRSGEYETIEAVDVFAPRHPRSAGMQGCGPRGSAWAQARRCACGLRSTDGSLERRGGGWGSRVLDHVDDHKNAIF